MKKSKNNDRALAAFVRKTDAAMRKMVSDVIEEHRRLNMPLVVGQNGKVVYLPADRISSPSVREKRGRYGRRKKFVKNEHK